MARDFYGRGEKALMSSIPPITPEGLLLHGRFRYRRATLQILSTRILLWWLVVLAGAFIVWAAIDVLVLNAYAGTHCNMFGCVHYSP